MAKLTKIAKEMAMDYSIARIREAPLTFLFVDGKREDQFMEDAFIMKLF